MLIIAMVFYGMFLANLEPGLHTCASLNSDQTKNEFSVEKVLKYRV